MSTVDFYPRSPCGERRRTKAIAAKISNFYPRSPCGERPLHLTFSERAYKFLSTLSLRRATSPVSVMARGIFISIHALLAESDIILRHSVSFSDDFYPRSPCGERPRNHQDHPGQHHFYPRSPCGERRYTNMWSATTPLFLSTLSLRRATAQIVALFIHIIISIHALLAESDSMTHMLRCCASIFLSTLSLRRATLKFRLLYRNLCLFLSTLSLRRATRLLYGCPYS